MRVSAVREHSAGADLLIAALGYESRSLHVAESIVSRKVILFAYGEPSSADYSAQAMRASKLSDVRVVDAQSRSKFEASLVDVLDTIVAETRVVVDVSSFDRRRLGAIFVGLDRIASQLGSLSVDVLYSPAEFSPPEDLDLVSIEAGPVSDYFRGRVRRSSLPLSAVFGLGYEPQRAIGGFELLEPSSAWAFMPESGDERYATSLASANRLFLSAFSSDEVLRYPVLDAADTYLRLESLVSNLEREYRVVLVPMGPKIFAAISLLLGLRRGATRPAVWRIGSSTPSSPKDVRALGPIVGLHVEF